MIYNNHLYHYRTRSHTVGPNKYTVKENSATSVENDWMIIYAYTVKVSRSLYNLAVNQLLESNSYHLIANPLFREFANSQNISVNHDPTFHLPQYANTSCT